ncbi:MBL fold metallo-hydrolase [bacterium]|nr:MBL fold metallo-hydrolase [bacterium]
MTNSIHFIGHASVLAKLGGQNFYIDTNFSTKLLGVSKRQIPVGIDLSNLPQPTALLVTHAHYDHLDLPSYKYFSQNIPIICPEGLGSLISKFLHNPVTELKSGSTHTFGDVSIHAVPTKHYGFRLSGLTYRNCLGYVLEHKNHTIYHPGDTAYGPHFKEIGQKFKIDTACLPIGAYRPLWIMKNRHMGPEDALQAFDDLQAKAMIPIHWGSFKLALDGLNESLEILKTKISGTPMASKIKILNAGEKHPLNS